jgi:hypothetical protein
MIAAMILLLWIGSGVGAYSGTVAYFQRQWPELAEVDALSDRVLGVFVAVLGPIGFCLVYKLSERFRYGFML